MSKNEIKTETHDCIYCGKELSNSESDSLTKQFHQTCYDEIREYNSSNTTNIKEIKEYNEAIKGLMLVSSRAKWIIPNLVKFFEIYQPLFEKAKTTKEMWKFDVFCAAYRILESFSYLIQFHNVSNQYGGKDVKLAGFIDKLELYTKNLNHYAEKYDFE